MKRTILVAVLVVGALGLSGCQSVRKWARPDPNSLCGAGEPYLTAQSVPPLKGVEGLALPNTRNGLKIPDATQPLRQRVVKDGCLDQPPKFDADAKPAVPTKRPDREAPQG